MVVNYTFEDRSLIEAKSYDYVDQVVRNIKRSLAITRTPEPIEIGVLLSIHIQSNRPDNFTRFLDELEAVTQDPKNVEVVIKIDDTDVAMNALLPKEIARRPFVIRYISTPLVGGFFELWRSMNDMLKVCNPDAYFLWNMNDEMAILNKDWDVMLAKYVGLFPDHIFRLRTSLFRFRNYHDYWENGFAPETSAITTKRWIDYGGDWNPCLGPDSFQQCVSYYFSWHDRFNKHKILRDVPIHDFVLAGEGAFVGLEGDKLWRRMRGATKAWFRLMSCEIQEEASRRAQKLHAHIAAHEQMLKEYEVSDNKLARAIELMDKETDTKLAAFPYELSWLRITFTNFFRSSRFFYYGGGGKPEQGRRLRRFLTFLILRYEWLDWCRDVYLVYKRHSIKWRATYREWRAQVSNPAVIKHGYKIRYNSGFPKKVIHYVWTVFTSRILNRGIHFHESVYTYDAVDATVDWAFISQCLERVNWPLRFQERPLQKRLIRCVLLKSWHQLSSETLIESLGRDLAMQHFARIPLNRKLPTVNLLDAFEALLKEQNCYDLIIGKASDIEFDNLPFPLLVAKKKSG